MQTAEEDKKPEKYKFELREHRAEGEHNAYHAFKRTHTFTRRGKETREGRHSSMLKAKRELDTYMLFTFSKLELLNMPF